ncbi:MAG: Hsp70 family protein, partial [Patescibacteria group bacterium]
ADQLIYTAEKALKDAGDKVPGDVKASVEQKIADVKKARESGTTEGIKAATEALSNEIQKIGQAMNQANQQPPNPTEPPPQQ